MTNRFDDIAALVVGAGHGIGRACAARLVAEGARVVVADVDLEAARSVAAEVDAVASVRLDVTDPASVRSGVAEAVTALGGLDVLAHVAGADAAHGGIEETGDDVWHAMLDLNTVGFVRVAREALPTLRRSDRGPAVVVVTSINGLTALGSEPYSAAKAATTSFVGTMAMQVAGDGIRVNAVAPGTIRTRVWDSQGGPDRLRGHYPLARIGEPEDVAAAVAFLGSRDAAWVTGQTLVVDGGMLAGHPFG